MSELSPGAEPGQETDTTSARKWRDGLLRLINDPRHSPIIPKKKNSAKDYVAQGERSPQVSTAWFSTIELGLHGLAKTDGIKDGRILEKVTEFKDMLNSSEAGERFSERLHTREDIDYAKWIIKLVCNIVTLKEFEQAEKEGFPTPEESEYPSPWAQNDKHDF